MFKLLSLIVLLSSHALSYASTDNNAEIQLKPIKIGAHSYYVKGFAGAASVENQGFMSNAGFVVTNDGVVVFDALGSPVLAKIWSQKLRKSRSSRSAASSSVIIMQTIFTGCRYSKR